MTLKRNFWKYGLKELDQTINYLSSNEIKDVLNNQDFIYKGDLKKWGKLANSLKLKLQPV